MGATRGAGTATLPEHLSSPPVYSGIRVIFSFMCRCFFVLFILAIVLSVLRYTDSDYPFGIFTVIVTAGTFEP
jgi:hypothetical protein